MNFKYSTYLQRILFSVIYGAFVSAACASIESSENYITPYVTDFDASVPDGGETAPEAECLEKGNYRFNNNFSPYFGGNASLDAEVVHFSSFYCSHCANFAAYTRTRWDNRTVLNESVRVYFHHASYYFRHRAAVAAQNQGDEYFWKLHDFIFDKLLSGKSVDEKEIVDFAQNTLKLDMKRFLSDLEDERTYAFLKWDANQGLTSGMQGTPWVYVCGKYIDEWPYLENYIEQYLQ